LSFVLLHHLRHNGCERFIDIFGGTTSLSPTSTDDDDLTEEEKTPPILAMVVALIQFQV
jgi:hypothetical protein